MQPTIRQTNPKLKPILLGMVTDKDTIKFKR